MTPKEKGWEERFDQNRPKTDDNLLETKQESQTYYFGYKHMEGGDIYEVTDWGNIKSFIKSVREEAAKEERERIRGLINKKMGQLPLKPISDYECGYVDGLRDLYNHREIKH